MAARDVRMEAESELAQARRRLELALEGGRVSVWDTDLRTGELFFSQGWNTLLGGDPAVTHTGIQAILALAHPEDVAGLLQAQIAMLKGTGPDYEVTFRVRHRSGEWCWVRSRGRVTERGPDGRALRASGTNWDVTEEMRTAERLRESEARYRRLTALTSEVYWEQDAELRFTRIEGSAAVRLPSAHYLGKRRWETGCTGVSDAAWGAHRADLEAHRPFRDFQLAQVLPDGRTVYLSVSGEPVFEAEGRFAGYRGVATDVTARREAEEMRRRESEDFARAVFNSFQASIAVLDAHGVITAVNDAWRRFAVENAADAAARDPVGQSYLEASARALSVEGDAAARAFEGIAGVLDGSRTRFEMEYACRAPHEQRWYAMTVLPLAGARRGALVAHADITERKRAEMALAESEERFATLFRSSPVAHALLRADTGRYIEVNEAWERTFGWSRPEALGRSSVEVGVWASEEDHRGFLRRFGAAGRVHEERTRRRRRNGEVFEAIVSAEPVELAGVRYRFTSVMDIDSEARALDALTRSEARFSALFRSSPVPIALVDLEADRYIDVNEAWENTFKHRRQDVVGKSPEAVRMWVDDDTRDRFLRALHQRGAVQGFAATLRDAAGGPVKTRVFTVRVEIGGRAHALTSSVDVTSETRAMNQIRRLNAELERRVVERTAKLEEALAELESFSYSVSHDLRAPARAVAGFSRVVLEDHGKALPAEGRHLLMRISRAGEAMGAMVDGLLELSRISREEAQRRPVDLAALAREVWRDLATLEPERDMALHIEGSLDAEGDPVLLTNLLLNLLGNARKYTRGRPEAAAWLGRSPQGEYYVRDNGVGFDPAHAGKLFQTFQRLHTEREFEGHGIGLALCRRIVERHGGRIRAAASPGEGATFYFSLS